MRFFLGARRARQPPSKFSVNEPFSQSDNARFDETMGDIPVISCEGREVLQRTRVRQVFQRGVV